MSEIRLEIVYAPPSPAPLHRFRCMRCGLLSTGLRDQSASLANAAIHAAWHAEQPIETPTDFDAAYGPYYSRRFA